MILSSFSVCLVGTDSIVGTVCCRAFTATASITTLLLVWIPGWHVQSQSLCKLYCLCLISDSQRRCIESSLWLKMQAMRPTVATCWSKQTSHSCARHSKVVRVYFRILWWPQFGKFWQFVATPEQYSKTMCTRNAYWYCAYTMVLGIQPLLPLTTCSSGSCFFSVIVTITFFSGGN